MTLHTDETGDEVPTTLVGTPYLQELEEIKRKWEAIPDQFNKNTLAEQEKRISELSASNARLVNELADFTKGNKHVKNRLTKTEEENATLRHNHNKQLSDIQEYKEIIERGRKEFTELQEKVQRYEVLLEKEVAKVAHWMNMAERATRAGERLAGISDPTVPNRIEALESCQIENDQEILEFDNLPRIMGEEE